MVSARRTPPVLLVMAALASCGPRAEDYPFVRTERCGEGCDAGSDASRVRTDAGPPEVPPEPLEPWDTAGAGPLSGIFALEVAVPARVVVEVETRQLYRVRMLHRGRDLRIRVQPCRIVLPSIRGVADLALTAAAQRVIQTKIIETEGPVLSSEEPLGATFAPPPSTVVVGAMLADPERDPLPTREDPSTALDEDGDGQPGVTLDANAIVCRRPQQVYVALRARVALSGIIDSLDAFEGDVAPMLDQSVLGVSDRCLNAAADLVIEILPGARFRAARVGGPDDLDGNGNVSCPEIVWASSRLFGEYWVSVD